MNQPPRRPVDPQLLFGISLFAGLLLAWPALRSAMHGGTDIVVAGMRLLVAIAFAWTGGYLITTLFTSYAATAGERERLERERPVRDGDGYDGPLRRAGDPVALPAGESAPSEPLSS